MASSHSDNFEQFFTLLSTFSAVRSMKLVISHRYVLVWWRQEASESGCLVAAF